MPAVSCDEPGPAQIVRPTDAELRLLSFVRSSCNEVESGPARSASCRAFRPTLPIHQTSRSQDQQEPICAWTQICAGLAVKRKRSGASSLGLEGCGSAVHVCSG